MQRDQPPAQRSCRGTQLHEGSPISRIVQANPPGTTFCLEGTFQLQQPLVLKPYQQLIGPATITARAGSVPHDGLVTALGTGVRALDISGFRIGIRILGDRVKVQNNSIHENSRSGIGGPGNHTLVEGNEIFRNGSPAYFRCCAAGIKYVGVGVIIRNNAVYDNTHGVWADLDGNGSLITGNEVTNNQYNGIFIEISADALIRDNVVSGNNQQGAERSAGISIHSSQGISVIGNELGDNERFGIRTSEDLEREPSEDVVISHNRLNGDSIGGCHISECFDNT